MPVVSRAGRISPEQAAIPTGHEICSLLQNKGERDGTACREFMPQSIFWLQLRMKPHQSQDFACEEIHRILPLRSILELPVLPLFL